MIDKIGLFYGSSTCYTEIAAEKIRDIVHEQLGRQSVVTLYNVADSPLSLVMNYDYLILGIPTWDYGELQEDWEVIWDDMEQLDLSGKTIALYGLGDQAGYPEWFQDALGYLWAKVVNLGAKTVGLWPVDGYTFEQSKALTADGQHFVGLALDEETEFLLSNDRLQRWCEQILHEFATS